MPNIDKTIFYLKGKRNLDIDKIILDERMLKPTNILTFCREIHSS